ncbi:MAG: peptidoglycan DD-metalloendopeptidase family protein [Ardenticatenales bacterium]|nr:peptidoglycan DD-metalloendopeptidase family protein [Ardenticatenales bacterium]
MNKGTNGFWQRYGGHLVLFVVALLVFVWARTSAAKTLFDFGWNSEPAAEQVSEQSVPDTALPSATITPLDDDMVVDMDQLPIMNNTGLSPELNPITFAGKKPTVTYETYTVKQYDTPNGIAQKFGINAETLLGGNPQLSQEASLLQVGMELKILPIDGVLHDVQAGDTVETVAAKYSVSVDDIINYAPNNLEFPYRLYPDTQIMVPGAVREVFVWNPPTISTSTSSSSGNGFGIKPLVVGTGTFVWPVNGRRITQYYWYGHRGIDVALAQGSPVFASDTGTVVWADWNIHCYGNLIVVDHGNGFVTFYAHLSAINVYPGQIVTQGQVMGAVGTTGCSSGPHLHFEIRLNGVQQDPFWAGYLSN